MAHRPYPDADRPWGWVRAEAPSEEECRAVGEYALEHGIHVTVVGDHEDIVGEAPPVDEYRLSSRPGTVSGSS